MLRPILFVLLLTFIPASAHAARFSGAYLLEVCEVANGGNEKVKGGHATCQSYISGVIDYHNMLQSMKLSPDLKICIPDSASLYDLHLAVLHYLRANNQHDGFTAAPAVTTAIYTKYPCKKK